MMTLERVLREVNKDTFHITDYEKLEDPVKRRIRMDPTKGFDNSPYNEDEKDQLFNETVQKIITRTYQAVAEANVVSGVIVRNGVDIDDLYWLVSNVCATIKRSFRFDNSYDDLSICSNPEISVLMVKYPDKFAFNRVFQHIEFNLKSNPNFKLILVGTGDHVDSRILPVLNKYTRYR